MVNTLYLAPTGLRMVLLFPKDKPKVKEDPEWSWEGEGIVQGVTVRDDRLARQREHAESWMFCVPQPEME